MTMPLCDKEAEQSVIGSMIIDKDAVLIAGNMLEPDDFYCLENVKTFEILKSMNENDIEIDLITLKAELENKGYLEAVGGIKYIADVANSVPTSAHVKRYAKRVQELSFRRKCLVDIENIRRNVYEAEYTDLIKSIDSMADIKIKTDDIEPLTSILEDALEEVNNRMQSKDRLTGIPTGFNDIDCVLGGLQDTDYVVLAARPSMGKTAFALDILRKAAKSLKKENKIIIFFSLEMSAKKLGLRLLSSEMKIKNERFKFGDLDTNDIEILKRDAGAFENMIKDVYIDDTSSMTIQDMFSKCYTQKCNTNKQIGLIVIDYLQLIASSSNYNNRNNEVAEISRNIKKMAKEFNCPVLALSQLNRATDTRADKKPILSDLRDSGAIEQDADVVMMLHREEYYNPTPENQGKAEVIIAKHREGETGTINLTFVKEISSFRNAKI